MEESTLLGAAAAISSIAGVILAILGHRLGKKSAEAKAVKETHEQLLLARKEAEDLSAELHKLKMGLAKDETSWPSSNPDS